MFEPAIGACVEQNLTLTLSDMDETLRADKGWVRYSNQGQEFVYEYCVKDSDIRIKVQSGICVRSKKMDYPGLDAIRVFAILYIEARGNRKKMVRGLCKSRIVRPGGDWKTRLKRAYEDTLSDARGRAPRSVH